MSQEDGFDLNHTLSRFAGEGMGERLAAGSAWTNSLYPLPLGRERGEDLTVEYELPSGQAQPAATRIFAALALLTLFCTFTAHADGYIQSNGSKLAAISAMTFESVLPPSEETKQVSLAGFQLDTAPATNAEYAAFVREHPEWQRDQVARLFADEQYLSHWAAPIKPAAGTEHQPVVHVSWFAASAYCEARGARLATWHEWELAAAASESKRDARNDPQWRQQILEWYSKSGRGALPNVGQTPANIYGVRDLHGVVWEWIEDLPALLVANDSREQGDPSQMRFCGAGAISMEQKENYAMLMRIAMLSSMKANYTSATMGFRCARDGAPK